MDENVLRNIKRINIRLRDLVNVFSNKQKEIFKNYKILRENKEVTLDDINFKEPMVFICDEDFSSYISYYGLLKINDVRFPDTTLSGTYSMIRTSYTIVDSADIRFTKIPLDAFYKLERDGVLPDSWNSINVRTRELVIWRLVPSVGQGDNDKMYDACYSWIAERVRSGLKDWIFYIGSVESYKNEYTSVANLHLPTYVIKPKKEGKKPKEVEEKPTSEETVERTESLF